jgi:hypothetical protein
VFLDAVAAVDVTAPADVLPSPPFFRLSVDEQFAALLQDRGLTEVEVKTIVFDHPVPTADELWDGVLAGTVRVSALILRQHEPARRRPAASAPCSTNSSPNTSAVTTLRCPFRSSSPPVASRDRELAG